MKEEGTWIDNISQNRTLTHVLFWVVWLLLTTTIASLNMGGYKNHLIHNVCLLPAQIIAAYLLVYYQVPNLLYKKKYLQFLISLLLSVILLGAVARLSIIYIAEPFFREDFQQESILEIFIDIPYLIGVYFPSVYMIAFIMLIIKTFKERFESKHQMEVLQKEKKTAELNFLKAQIHPHFLFNTLNNLYALTLEKSDDAPEVVVKLSEMLDYMLYQCGDPKVAISKEVELLKSYMDLETLRYGENLDLKFNQKIDDPAVEIAPLILLCLIENAFKHGASGNLINPLINIDLKVLDQELKLKVFNTKSENRQSIKGLKKQGVGAKNIKRQLDLIYPGQYELEIVDQEKDYLVNLSIQL